MAKSKNDKRKEAEAAGRSRKTKQQENAGQVSLFMIKYR